MIIMHEKLLKLKNSLKNSMLQRIASGDRTVFDQDYNFIDKIVENNIRVDFITIDVAHGHHILVKDMITYIKDRLNVKVIAGNIGVP